jgi:hypothetical protein
MRKIVEGGSLLRCCFSASYLVPDLVLSELRTQKRIRETMNTEDVAVFR